MSAIDAVYIYDEHKYDNLLFLSPSTSGTSEPLLVLEFLHRVADALEEFLGSPLLASKISANYDVVAQILAEIADGGVVCQGEANALRDVVETGPGVLNHILGKVGIPGNNLAPGTQTGIGPTGALQRLQATGSGSGLGSQTATLSSAGSAIPWRRSNVRHTSNELYVDIVETLSVTLAPSGRPLAAFAYGSIAFTSKVSGVPDLLLSLSTGGMGSGMGNRGDQLRSVMERVVFHPCVRLNKWKSEGVMSFVPPDGKFVLCGYEVDLLGADAPFTAGSNNALNSLNLPATVRVTTGLGTSGNEFEVRISQPVSSSLSNARSAATTSLQSNLGSNSRNSAFKAGSAGDSKGPTIENLVVNIPLPTTVRNVTDLHPSKGEAAWNPVDGVVEWRVPAKDFGPLGAVLRCAVQGPHNDGGDEIGGVLNGLTATTYDYNDDEPSSAYQSQKEKQSTNGSAMRTSKMASGEKNRELMPTSATVSFGVKGWLASGLKVESLLLDVKKSRGLGAEVKPYKGVKYLSVSRRGVEVRC
ncbi:hypothetical protein LTR62_006715 [Meristemomyces frigidus]|uniref:MHD domain-containing protein n=1 Tax=Meristemomyces frigidus TaxID=1508187 RepID=A0AAN7TMP4_9PEZI|nr:hypothetical protein LTR62_006715 [Meristemomyces frigidus]